MTDYHGAFSTSTSKFLGQIQSTNIGTSYKSILTCLSNNEKIENIISAKCSPVSALSLPPPPPPNPMSHGAELWGAESLQSPTLTGPSARGSSNALLLQCLYIWGKKPHLLPCGSISFTLTTRNLVLVPSLFRSSAVVNLHFFRPKSWSRKR